MKNRYKILVVVSFLIFCIISINFFSGKEEKQRRILEKKYFKNLDIHVSGRVIRVEKQKNNFNFLILLEIDNSNYKSYNEKVLGTVFCMIKENKAVFADSEKNYSKGDIVQIGGNSKDILVLCKDSLGRIKYSKKRGEILLNFISSPERQMFELLQDSTDL